MSFPLVGWIGLGAMGSGMSSCLLSQGFTVKAYDIAPASVEKAKAKGAIGCSSLQEVATGVDILVLMVVNAIQVEDILFGTGSVAEFLKEGSTVICFATVAPEYIATAETRLEKRGVFLVDSPVSGGFVRAGDGQLTIMVAGSPAAISAARPVLSALSRAPGRLINVGGRIGGGSDFKLIHQIFATNHIAGCGEAMALGCNLGANPRKLYEEICSSPSQSFMFTQRVSWQLVDDGVPKSAMTIIHKDAGIIMDDARARGFPLPLSAASEQVFNAAIGAGLSREDDGNVVKLWEKFGGRPILKGNAEHNSEVAKVIENMLEALYVVTAVEAFAFAAKKGLDLQMMFDVCSISAGASPTLNDRIPRLLAGDKTVHHTINQLLTKLSLVIEAGKKTNTPLFLSSVLYQQVVAAAAAGLGEEDDTALIRLWAPVGVEI